jgi:DNA-directed RNA polymerases I, II, and III subunit RPABC3
MAETELLSTTLSVTQINSGKYDRVFRISAQCDSPDMILTLDINSELYPVSVGDKYHLVLASTLALDGTKDDGKMWRDVGKGMASLADHYEYVMHGKVYRFEEGSEDKM